MNQLPRLRPLGRVRRGAAGPTAGLIVAGLILLALGYALGQRRSATVEDAAGGDPHLAETATDSDVPTGTPAQPEPATSGGGEAPAVVTDSSVDAVTGPSPIEFDPPVLDFGIVQPDIEMSEVVHVTNVTDDPVRIITMRADCKCTTAQDLSGRVIQPGEVVPFTTVVDGRPYPGSRENEIRFAIDGYGVTTYRIVSEVSRAVRTEPSHFTTTHDQSGVILVSSIIDRPFSILEAGGRPPVYADDFDPDADAPRTRYRLAWDLAGYDPSTCLNAAGERMPYYWVIHTDDPDAPVLDVRVRSLECTLPEPPGARQWGLSIQRAVIDALRPGESAEFTTYLKWRGDIAPTDTIREVVSESDQFEAELVALDRVGDRITCTVRITPHDDHDGPIDGTVRFHAFRSGSQLIHILGRVDR